MENLYHAAKVNTCKTELICTFLKANYTLTWVISQARKTWFSLYSQKNTTFIRRSITEWNFFSVPLSNLFMRLKHVGGGASPLLTGGILKWCCTLASNFVRASKWQDKWYCNSGWYYEEELTWYKLCVAIWIPSLTSTQPLDTQGYRSQQAPGNQLFSTCLSDP